MNLKYLTYEPDKGMEDFQAKLFNDATGRNVTGEEIRQRYIDEKIDPKTVRYVFSEDGKLLSYCQARDYPRIGEIHIGYPWATKDCPKEAQEKIFDELLEHLKNRKTDLKIKLNLQNQEGYFNFAKEKGFESEEHNYGYVIDIDQMLNYDTSAMNYSSRKGTNNDIELIKKRYREEASDADTLEDDFFTNFIKLRINEDHLNLLFDGDYLIGLVSPFLPGETSSETEPYLIFRFYFTAKKYSDVMPFLLKIAAEDCKNANWEKNRIRMNARTLESHEFDIIEKISDKKILLNIKFKLK